LNRDAATRERITSICGRPKCSVADRVSALALLKPSTHRRLRAIGFADGGQSSAKCCDTLRNCNDAQRAPSARLGIADTFRECAQTISGAPAKSAIFSGDFETCGGSKNRRLRRCKISISEVLISVTLSVHGEVAERLKAAVC
jgi:hypothetical protein